MSRTLRYENGDDRARPRRRKFPETFLAKIVDRAALRSCAAAAAATMLLPSSPAPYVDEARCFISSVARRGGLKSRNQALGQPGSPSRPPPHNRVLCEEDYPDSGVDIVLANVRRPFHRRADGLMPSRSGRSVDDRDDSGPARIGSMTRETVLPYEDIPPSTLHSLDTPRWFEESVESNDMAKHEPLGKPSGVVLG